MTSLADVLRVILACSLVLGQVSAGNLPKTFAATLIGLYNNEYQRDEGVKDHDLMELTALPVTVSGMEEETIVYMDEKVNGVLYRCEVFVIADYDNSTVMISRMNITDTRRCRPGDPNVTDFAPLSRADLQDANPDCNAAVQYTPPATFSGDLPDCRDVINGKHPLYVTTNDCQSMRVVPPVEAKEAHSILPYELKKYQYVDAGPGYPSVCDRTQ